MNKFTKTKRKTLSLIMAAAVSAGMLTACGNNPSTQSPESTPPADTTGSKTEAVTSADIPETAETTAVPEADNDLAILHQNVIDSPEWLTKLDAVSDTEQIIVVAGVGETTAYVSMHEKNSDGKWEMLLQTPGYIGLEGMGDADCDHAMTPVGTFTVGKAFGIADDPGCQIEYTKVTADDYWSGDMREGMHFNEFVNINDVPGLDPNECEHLIDYTYEYTYFLDMGYNPECIPEEGSCFFFHCMSLVKPYTGGCVAVNEAVMKEILRRIKPGCKITIDTADNLGIDLNEARTVANKLV